MMDNVMDNVKDKIKEIICTHTYIEQKDLTSLKDDSLLTQIGLDSINVVYIIGEIEDEFEFSFNDEDLLLVNFETIEKIENLIQKYTE